MKKLLATMAAMLLTVAGLSACTAMAKQVNNENDNENEKQEVMDLKGKKVLVAYFSWSDNTKYAAQHIAQKLGADRNRNKWRRSAGAYSNCCSRRTD